QEAGRGMRPAVEEQEMSGRIPAVVIGGTGYVAGELLRLISAHPFLRLAGVASGSQAGKPVAEAFPHLAPVLGDRLFEEQAGFGGVLIPGDSVAVFSAAPHAVSATGVASAL